MRKNGERGTRWRMPWSTAIEKISQMSLLEPEDVRIALRRGRAVVRVEFQVGRIMYCLGLAVFSLEMGQGRLHKITPRRALRVARGLAWGKIKRSEWQHTDEEEEELAKDERIEVETEIKPPSNKGVQNVTVTETEPLVKAPTTVGRKSIVMWQGMG